MPQSNDFTSGLRDDEYEFPDDLEGIDWSTVGPIEGDEPKPEITARVQTQSSLPESQSPATELPPRPSSSSSSYGFPDIGTLDEDDLAELNETERLYGLTSGDCTQPIHRPYAHPRSLHRGDPHEYIPKQHSHTSHHSSSNSKVTYCRRPRPPIHPVFCV